MTEPLVILSETSATIALIPILSTQDKLNGFIASMYKYTRAYIYDRMLRANWQPVQRTFFKSSPDVDTDPFFLQKYPVYCKKLINTPKLVVNVSCACFWCGSHSSNKSSNKGTDSTTMMAGGTKFYETHLPRNKKRKAT